MTTEHTTTLSLSGTVHFIAVGLLGDLPEQQAAKERYLKTLENIGQNEAFKIDFAIQVAQAVERMRGGQGK